MLAKILSGAVVGLNAVPVTVEVDVASRALPSFSIVGLPDKAVEESKERVRSAIKNSGAEFPRKRITVNLAPADLPKKGPLYDLPIALGILIASGQIGPIDQKSLYIGELSLDGTLRHTNGVLLFADLAKKENITHVFVPEVDGLEAAVVSGIRVYPVFSISKLFHHIAKTHRIRPLPHTSFQTRSPLVSGDFNMRDIKGQEQVKRAVEIASAGGHNMYMQGVPGAGKTMIARTVPSILPILTEDEALEVTKIYSVTGNLAVGQSLISVRPFRAPHHTTSRIGLIGGGTHPMPGEISLAHRGVLFLDEFPEFPRHVLEALRQPMEDGIIAISRARATVQYPAKFMLLAASNPCPCGNFGAEGKECTCLPGAIQKYQKRVSGPLLDRIDLHVSVPAVRVEKLIEQHKTAAEGSETIRKRVQKARNRQNVRYEDTLFTNNAELSTKAVKEHVLLSSEVKTFLRQAVTRLGLSARSYFKVIKVSRTIADLEGERDISISHVAEAVQYRPKENR